MNHILKEDMLDGLIVVKDTDYQNEVTVRHLLGHTSGVNDYFECKTFDGSTFTDEMISNPDTFWTPEALINYTRERQKAIAKPGDKFFYSDTGYLLLGFIVEAVFGMPFHQALETYLFQPAENARSSRCHGSTRLARPGKQGDFRLECRQHKRYVPKFQAVNQYYADSVQVVGS